MGVGVGGCLSACLFDLLAHTNCSTFMFITCVLLCLLSEVALWMRSYKSANVKWKRMRGID